MHLHVSCTGNITMVMPPQLACCASSASHGSSWSESTSLLFSEPQQAALHAMNNPHANDNMSMQTPYPATCSFAYVTTPSMLPYYTHCGCNSSTCRACMDCIHCIDINTRDPNTCIDICMRVYLLQPTGPLGPRVVGGYLNIGALEMSIELLVRALPADCILCAVATLLA